MSAVESENRFVTRSRALSDRLLEPVFAERFARIALGAATAIYAVLVLWLTRGATFTFEELIYFGTNTGLDPGDILRPYDSGGHLIAVTRLLFDAGLRVFGADQLPFQLAVIVLSATTSWLLFVLIKRRVGPLLALAAAVLILFLGTTPEVIHGWTTMWVQATAAGLGALVALDNNSRRADIVAAVLLVVAILSFSVGVAFAICAGVMIVARGERRRLWVAVVPLVLFAAWWLWAQKYGGGGQSAENILLAPTWAADSFAAACAALSGLGVDLTDVPSLWTIDLGWGRIIAVVVLIAAGLGVKRHGWTPLLWGAIAFVLVLWLGQGLLYSREPLSVRTPDLDRYAYPVAIGVLLVLAASFQGAVPTRRILLVVAALAAFALPVNLWQLRERGNQIREESDLVKARLAVVDLERDFAAPDKFPVGPEGGVVTIDVGTYLAASDRYGSLGYSTSELETASDEARRAADETLQGELGLGLTPVARGGSHCGDPSPQVTVPAGQSVLRADLGGNVKLGRFAAEPTIDVGALGAGQAGSLTLPDDGVSQPWTASIDAGTLRVCQPG